MTTTIKAVWPGEKTEDIKEIEDRRGSSQYVWDRLAKKYIANPHTWTAWKHTRAAESYLAVLMLTCERAYVLRKDFDRMSEDIQIFLDEATDDPDCVNHWLSIALLFHMASQGRFSDVPAMGLHCSLSSPYPYDWDSTFDVYQEIDHPCDSDAPCSVA